MTPVIHCSIGNISLFPLGSLRTCREIQPRKFCDSEKSRLASSSCQMLLLPQPALRFIGVYNRSWGSRPRRRTQVVAAVETDVTVEEPNPAPSGKAGDESSGASTTSVEASEPVEAATTTTKIRRKRPGRKSEMPPVKDEELVPGASFTGKVRAIQPFGLFVDFGAFTDGLVHISRVSDGFTKDVASLFTVGQEVTVRIVEADKETGRISLTMRSSDDATKVKPTTPRGENNRTAPRSPSRLNARQKEAQKSSKFVKGQQLNGTVKNLTRSGSFVSLPDGEEGFLPVAEESEGFGAALGNSSLQVGQEVSVRVLRIARGQVTLTMKKEQDVEGLKKKLGQGIEHTATNPFQLAFRRNKEISAFLDGREKVQKSSEKLGISKASEAPVTAAVVESETDTATSSDQLEDKVSESESLEVDSSTTTTEEPEVENAVNDKLDEPSATDSITEEEDSPSSSALVDEDASKDEASRRDLSSPSSSTVDESPELRSAAFVDEAAQEDSSDSSSDSVVSEISVPEETEDSTVVTDTVEDQALNLNSPISEGDESSPNSTPESSNADLVSETEDRDSVVSEISVPEETKDSTAVTDTVEDQALNSNTPVSEGDESSSNSTLESSSAELVSETEDKPAEPEVSSLSESSAAEAAPVTDEAKEADVAVAALSSSAEDALVSDSQQATIPEIASSSQPEDKITNGSVEKKTAVPVEKEANAAENGSADQGSSVKATISAALVKQLREETGAGMMDCKKALAESGGDLVKAQEFLRKKGLASADKKAGRATSEGSIGSYIHDNRIGVLIEVNCETDFVSRGEIFKELVDDLAMQVAACPQVKYLSTEDIPEEIVNKEKEIEMQKEDLLSKPEQIRSKIVEGRVRKRLAEVALLEQPYIKNDKVVVKDWVKQTIAAIGENMKVRRFVRYNLGEGLEKKSQDFAAEVAAQTAAKPAPSVPKDKPAEETTENVEKKPTVSISPALVKQLREETGAGMMDCKKALSETGGDLEKAQEYLRKKGLSSADKKSSRLAAEGLVSSYIHDSRIGCLIEVNSETDFVARNEKFKELVNDLAMQVVACPQVEYVSVEDIPESMISKEKEIEMQREDLQSKPENIRERIVEGRISKRLGELALLEQPFIKDDSKTVKDLVKETIAALGENIKVRRFVRYTLGENKE